MSYFIINDEIQLYYEEIGPIGRTPIIFLNGIVFTTASWYFQKKYFGTNQRMVYYDMRCQGASSKSKLPFTLDVQVEDLRKMMVYLKIQKAVICGISYGSFVAKEFALRHPESCEKLILMTPVKKVDFVNGLVYKIWRNLLEKNLLEEFYDVVVNVSYNDIRKNLTERIYKPGLKNFLDSFDVKSILFLLNSFDLEKTFVDYVNISVPSLIIGAINDKVHNPADAESIASEIPNAKLRMITGGHIINIENHEELNSAIEEFILS